MQYKSDGFTIVQALIPEALIPLSLATHDTCYVLCGDPRQLGPVVQYSSPGRLFTFLQCVLGWMVAHLN